MPYMVSILKTFSHTQLIKLQITFALLSQFCIIGTFFAKKLMTKLIENLQADFSKS